VTEIVLGLTIALGMLCIVGGYGVMQQRRRYEARLQAYLAGMPIAGATTTIDLPTHSRPSRRLFGISQLSLTQAGMTIMPRRFVIIQLVLAVGLASIVWLFGRASGMWLLALLAAAAAVGLAAPHLYVGFKRKRRVRKFENQFAQALDSLANAVGVGLGIAQAIEVIGRDMPEPIGPEFAKVLRSMGMGVSLAEALDQLAERVPSRDVDLFVAALSIQYRTGGALGPILRKIADTVRERINMRSEISALTGQQRYSAYIIALMPVFLFIVIKFLSPSYFSLIVQPGIMRIILVGSAIGIAAGLHFMLRIADVEI
jgi:tight adherence protein B